MAPVPTFLIKEPEGLPSGKGASAMSKRKRVLVTLARGGHSKA
jgi:hypothetical protein